MKPEKAKAAGPDKRLIGQILARLEPEYGSPGGNPSGDPVSVLVETILSQNTSDANSSAAFKRLKSTFATWDDAANADASLIEECIRRGGLARIKAPRIKAVLKEIIGKRGRLELDFLSQLTPSEAEEWLVKLPGVGRKTARCVLLFALDIAVLPVDTHIWRVAKRLGLISPQASTEEAHRLLGAAVPPESAYLFHTLLIAHGRRTCHPLRPRCPDCVLKRLCASYPL
ncbi:MAG: endonuclease III [Chloroflexota bacterium]